MPLLMAVSASATLFMVVAVAVAVVSATPAATIATASATSFAAQYVEHALYFVFCRIAVFSDFADEVQRFSGQGMIQVYGYGIFFHICDCSVKTCSVCIHQRHHASRINMLFVKVSVYFEYIFVQFQYAFLFILTVSFFYGQCEVEFLSFL